MKMHDMHTNTWRWSICSARKSALLRHVVNQIPANVPSQRLHLTLWRAKIRPDREKVRTGHCGKKKTDMNQKEKQRLERVVNDLELLLSQRAKFTKWKFLQKDTSSVKLLPLGCDACKVTVLAASASLSGEWGGEWGELGSVCLWCWWVKSRRT